MQRRRTDTRRAIEPGRGSGGLRSALHPVQRARTVLQKPGRAHLPGAAPRSALFLGTRRLPAAVGRRSSRREGSPALFPSSLAPKEKREKGEGTEKPAHFHPLVIPMA